MHYITLVTFLIGKEDITTFFIDLSNRINNDFKNVNIIVVTEEEKYIKNEITNLIKQVILPKTSKFSRIVSILNIIKSDYILLVDNDISGNLNDFINFVKLSISLDSDVAYVNIRVKKPMSITEKIVDIDKLLSHNILRPLLWKLKIGITLPGQVLFLKRKSFDSFNLNSDTFLEDLSFGLDVKLNNLKVNYYNFTFYENAKENFIEIFKQRKRWANGYSSIIKNRNKSYKNLFYIFAHGFSYHLLWILLLLLLIFIFYLNKFLPFFLITYIFVLLSEKKITKIPWIFLYIFIFPVFHLFWFYNVIYYLIKGDKND